ncbi:hypothetical protein [Candidatus Epulonipiscium viviparus]|uniref:hypothetical protein n=1 Tax=Candidatus Epulonipiscium viviparus TaxID=420336 RepID=UPI0027381332|nr:hypothetical protein [Candidatus Epulopiscium viviparus]
MPIGVPSIGVPSIGVPSIGVPSIGVLTPNDSIPVVAIPGEFDAEFIPEFSFTPTIYHFLQPSGARTLLPLEQHFGDADLSTMFFDEHSDVTISEIIELAELPLDDSNIVAVESIISYDAFTRSSGGINASTLKVMSASVSDKIAISSVKAKVGETVAIDCNSKAPASR